MRSIRPAGISRPRCGALWIFWSIASAACRHGIALETASGLALEISRECRLLARSRPPLPAAGPDVRFVEQSGPAPKARPYLLMKRDARYIAATAQHPVAQKPPRFRN